VAKLVTNLGCLFDQPHRPTITIETSFYSAFYLIFHNTLLSFYISFILMFLTKSVFMLVFL